MGHSHSVVPVEHDQEPEPVRDLRPPYVDSDFFRYPSGDPPVGYHEGFMGFWREELKERMDWRRAPEMSRDEFEQYLREPHLARGLGTDYLIYSDDPVTVEKIYDAYRSFRAGQ